MVILVVHHSLVSFVFARTLLRCKEKIDEKIQPPTIIDKMTNCSQHRQSTPSSEVADSKDDSKNSACAVCVSQGSIQWLYLSRFSANDLQIETSRYLQRVIESWAELWDFTQSAGNMPTETKQRSDKMKGQEGKMERRKDKHR